MTATEVGGVVVRLSERFESVQGEGPFTGQRCVFVRFSHCNLTCGWCDEKKTWDWARFDPREVSSRVPVAELVDWARERPVDLLVITGGEPMIQQPAMIALAGGVRSRMRVQVETNGTQTPCPELVELVDLWVVSPKLSHSGVRYDRRIVPAALSALRGTGRAVFKFVVTGTADFDEIDRITAELGVEASSVWVMPEAVTAQAVTDGVAALHGPASERGWQVSTRRHILDGVR
ncbi:7-carboxy-7-deazaguanine synthase QueE [Nocardia takedensis]